MTIVTGLRAPVRDGDLQGLERDELVLTAEELKPEELWITHGNEEALLRWATLNNIAATALEIAGYEDEAE